MQELNAVVLYVVTVPIVVMYVVVFVPIVEFSPVFVRCTEAWVCVRNGV